MKVYVHDDGDAVDRAYDDQVQREVDAEMEGARVGANFGAAGVNPHPLGTAEYLAWERGRLNAIGRLLSRAA